MTHELKIILGPTAHKTLVMIDDRPIGLIQDIKFHVGIDSVVPEIEIVFPNLFSDQIDQNYKNNSVMVRELKNSLDLLKTMPHVKVTLQELDFKKP